MRKGYSNRKQWGAPNPQIEIQTEEEPLDEVAERHEEYLLLLQERNRVVKKYKQKSTKQKELEQKEQGFSLYLNGANEGLALQKKHKHSSKSSRSKPRKTKTAEAPKTEREKALTHREPQYLDEEYSIENHRSKTAPEKVNRKNWSNSSLQIKTSRGEKVRIKPPGILTGEYEDDFEVDESSE